MRPKDLKRTSYVPTPTDRKFQDDIDNDIIKDKMDIDKFKRLRSKLTEDINQREYKKTRDELTAHIKQVRKRMGSESLLTKITSTLKPRGRPKKVQQSPSSSSGY